MQENINKEIVQLEPITTKRDKKGFRFYSTNNGNTLYAEKNGKIYNVSEDSLNVLSEVPLAHRRFEFIGIVSDEDVKNLYPLYYEYKTFGRVKEQFGMAKGGEIEIGDYVKIKETYGGGSGTVQDIVNNFVVVKTKEGKKSYHESDLIAYSSASEAAYDLGDEGNEDYEDDYAKGGVIKVGDTIKIKDGLSGKLMNIEGENLEVKRITEYPTFNGVTKFYHVEYDGYEYDVREDKVEYKKIAQGGELESKMQNLLQYLNWFPYNAKSWGQATDELRDIARMARMTFLEVDEKEYPALDFKTLKTPSDWNREGRFYITDMYFRMSDEAKKIFLETFEETFNYKTSKMSHGGETHEKITFSVDNEKIDEILHNSFESQLEYVNDNGDVLYKLPKRQFDRLIDMSDSRGFDVDYENSEESVIIVYDNYAQGGEIPTITKEEWSKKQKDSKLKTEDGKYYIMKYDDKIGTYLQQVKVLEDGSFIENTYEVFYYDADGEKHISKPIKANSEEEAISKFENDSPNKDVSYAKKIMADGGFVNKTDEELKAMSDDELFAYLDAKAAYMKQYIRPLSAYKAKNFAATSKAIELKNEGTSKLDENFVDIKKINEQASKDADDYLSSKMASGGMVPGRYYKDNKGEEYRFVGESRGKLLFKDGEKVIEKSEDDFEDDYPKESKLFGFFKDGGELAKQKFDISDSEAAEDVFEWLIDNISEEIEIDEDDSEQLSESSIDEIVRYFNYQLENHYIETKESKNSITLYIIKKMAKGGEVNEEEIIDKLEQQFRGKDLWEDEILDEYEVKMFDWEEFNDEETFYKWKNKNSKKNYIVPFDSDDDSYIFILVPKNKMEEGGEVSKSGELKSKIEKILDKVLPGFYKQVFVRKNFIGKGEYIGIIMAASNYEINRVKGQYVQDVSLMLDVEEMDLHVQVFGGNGGNRIYLQPDINDPREKYLAMAGVKIPFRTPKKEEKFVLQAIEKFAESYKNALKVNKDRLMYKEYVNYDTLIMAKGGLIDEIKQFEKYNYPKPKTKGERVRAIFTHFEKKGYTNDEINKTLGKMKFGIGGETTFEDKVKAVQKNLLKKKKVPAIVQKDYGKTYDKEEAKESAQRIVGSQLAKWKEKNKMAKGGKTSVSPLKDRIFGSKKNKVGTASSKTSAKDIELNDSIVEALSEKAKKYNEKHSSKVSVSTLKAVMRRGMGAFSSSHRPGMTRQGWGYARVNKFLLKKGGTKVKAAYVQDDDLLENGGELKKKMRVSDKPKFKKFIELEERAKASMNKTKNYSKWNETVGNNYRRRWYKMASELRGWEGEFIPMGVKSNPDWIKYTEEQGAVEDYNFGDVLA